MWISKNFQDSNFQQPLSLDDKIMIYEDRVLGWKLDIADQVINGVKRLNGTEERTAIPHSGYATLDILFSYFEMIGKYEAGFAQEGKSKYYFKEGVFAVFPQLRQGKISAKPPGVTGIVISMADFFQDIMYEGIRCGLYHAGATSGRVVLTGEIEQPFAIDPQNMLLIVNPHLLVPLLKEHFASYIARLREPSNQILRDNFEVRFDFDNQV
jgi:hypothetical protein